MRKIRFLQALAKLVTRECPHKETHFEEWPDGVLWLSVAQARVLWQQLSDVFAQ